MSALQALDLPAGSLLVIFSVTNKLSCLPLSSLTHIICDWVCVCVWMTIGCSLEKGDLYNLPQWTDIWFTHQNMHASTHTHMHTNSFLFLRGLIFIPSVDLKLSALHAQHQNHTNRNSFPPRPSVLKYSHEQIHQVEMSFFWILKPKLALTKIERLEHTEKV